MTNRSRLIRTIALVAAIALVLPAETLADQGRGRGPAKKVAGKADKKPEKAEMGEKGKKNKPIAVDRDGHVRVIREYARGGSLPPGLAKRQALPPGLRKQLRERGTLPPGLQKHLIPVEGPFVTRLPAVPAHYQRYFAGDDLIVVDTQTNQIVAVIRDVWR